MLLLCPGEEGVRVRPASLSNTPDEKVSVDIDLV